MKKLLQERGHMLENHIERLWAYLTIQELLAKRYDPCRHLEWASSTPEHPLPLGLWTDEVDREGAVLGLRGCKQVRFTVLLLHLPS